MNNLGILMSVAVKNAPAILLVDDEPTILFTYKTILERDGYRVHTARSFAEGAQLLKEHTYDAVIADLNLERENLGLDLVRDARSLPSHPVTVVYTGFPSIEHLHDALKLQVDYLALKPVGVEEMRSALTRLIRHRHMRMSLASAC
ncbi:MAG TPA: response regulator [Terriglobales bacterium]|nr:response regulator [Terriglobales bacterium]